MRPWLAVALGGVALAGLLAACAENPVTGRQNFVMMSEAEEIKLGSESHSSILEEYGLYDNPALQAYVQGVGEQLAGKSHRAELVYRFTVVDSPQINAFALPGGYIYITRGLLAYLNSEAEMAAVLGHEIGHVTARHGVRQVSMAQAANIGYQIGAILLPELRTQAAQNLFNVLGSALISGYGRDNELEADRLGAEYLARVGYDPQAMIQVIAVLKNQEEFDKQLARDEGREPRAYHGVFASHPANDQRLQEVVGTADRFRSATSVAVRRDEFLGQLDGLVFGDGEREGIRRGNKFYHGRLGFGLSFPDGWRVENTPNAIQARSPGGDAQLIVTVEDITKRLTPRDDLLQRFKLRDLVQGEALKLGQPDGYTGLATLQTKTGPRQARLAVIHFDNSAYLLLGIADRQRLEPEDDRAIVATARSFHALTAEERRLAKPLSLQVIEARAETRFATLARGSAIPHHAEEQLRLLNARYPAGEPAAGQKIKIVQ